MSRKGSSPFSKFMVILDDLLLAEILCRLPSTKYVFRCKCVCKRWRALISDPNFTARFLCLQSGTAHVERSLINSKGEEFFSQVPRSPKPPLPAFKELRSLFHLKEEPVVVGTYSDLALCCATRDYQCDYYIGNTYTREWVALPPAPTQRHRTLPVGFICDPYYSYNVESSQGGGETSIIVNAKYRCKVVRILPFDQLAYSLRFNVEIFSSEIGDWRNSVVSFPKAFSLDEINADVGVAYNGMLYWPYHSGKFIIGLDPFMIDNNKSLSSCADGNMDHCICRLIELDEPAVVDSYTIQCLGVCGGCLRMCDFDFDTHTLLVWELEEEQGQMIVSTTGKLSLKCTRYLLDPGMVCGSLVVDLIAYDPNNDKILYLNIEEEIVMCNIHTKQWSKMERLSTCCGHFFFPLIVLPWWPTPVPRLPHAHGGGCI